MKTIELMGEPFNVSEEVADAIAAAQQDKKIAEAQEEIATARLEAQRVSQQASEEVKTMLDQLMELYRQGSMGLIDTGQKIHFLPLGAAISLEAEGSISRPDISVNRWELA